MCDERTLNDMDEHLRRNAVSRRRFGALTAGVLAAANLPRAADALEVKESDVVVKTPDGAAEAYFAHPVSGKHPAVLVWTDGRGLRSTFKRIGRRLAESGYAVLVPNPYYRVAKMPALPDVLDTTKPEGRALMLSRSSHLTPTTHVTDAQAFIEFIDAQAAVDTSRKMGTTGYCMGGPMTMRTAATRPDRVGAAGSFHGGNLVTADANSPHLLVPKIKAQYLFAIAENDDKNQPDAKTVLKDSFAAAKLKAEIEVYTGTLHGWCADDGPVYNQPQAERAWTRLLALLKTALV